MNQILQWLSGGDLRSDGPATAVANMVLENPQVFEDLIEGIDNPDAVIRGRTVDALEKVARERPNLLEPHLTDLIQVTHKETVMVVKMHLAMLFGDLAMYADHLQELKEILFHLLDDEYVFVRSWTISSLCIIARIYPDENAVVAERIALQQNSDSPAIRSRVRNALNILTDPNYPFPKGWIKSVHFSDL